MNERITSMEQIAIGDIIMRSTDCATLLVTTKFMDCTVEGLGFKGTEEVKPRRFFVGLGDLVRIGHVDLAPYIKKWINNAI